MKICVWKRRSVIWVLSFFVIALGTLFFCVNRLSVTVLSQKSSLPIYSVATEDKKVAIGINCAWGNDDIEDILALLESEKIKATFFIVGDWCDKYPDSVKRIYQTGNELGNHSNSHKDLTTLSGQNLISEIEDCTQKLEAITGATIDLFRCPSGAYNTNVIEQIKSLGYFPIQWDCDSLDWKGLTVNEQLTCIQKNLKNGSILLFHNDTDYSVEALKKTITELKSQGYSFSTVGDLIYKGEYMVDVTGQQKALNPK